MGEIAFLLMKSRMNPAISNCRFVIFFIRPGPGEAGLGFAYAGEAEEREPGGRAGNRKNPDVKYNTTGSGSFQAFFATFLKVFSIYTHKYMSMFRHLMNIKHIDTSHIT